MVARQDPRARTNARGSYPEHIRIDHDEQKRGVTLIPHPGGIIAIYVQNDRRPWAADILGYLEEIDLTGLEEAIRVYRHTYSV
jgi:hypothetical protein